MHQQSPKAIFTPIGSAVHQYIWGPLKPHRFGSFGDWIAWYYNNVLNHSTAGVQTDESTEGQLHRGGGS